MSNDEQRTLTLKIHEKFGTVLSASTLSRFVFRVLAVLDDIERARFATSKNQKVVWGIAFLSKNSPATLALIPTEGPASVADGIAYELVTGLSKLGHNEFPDWEDLDTFRDTQSLVHILRERTAAHMSLSYNGVVAEPSADISHKIDAWMNNPKRFFESKNSSLIGVLTEALLGKKKRFTLNETGTGHRVSLTIAGELKETSKTLLESRVLAKGSVKWSRITGKAVSMNVAGISAFGRARSKEPVVFPSIDFLGDIDSGDAVRQMRDEEE